MKKLITIIILMAFWANSVLPGYAQVASRVSGMSLLPKPGTMVSISPAFFPPVLKGVKVDVKDPFKFDFILSAGDAAAPDAARESAKLVRYFMASLAVPENDLWVNLSPYEKDRIVPDVFGVTEMGRDLLAQDYLLKQITASLMYPEAETGKVFWAEIYKKAQEQFGTTSIPIDTFNKVWIVPAKAVVYEDGNKAMVVEAKLKVMLESDYTALEHHVDGVAGQDASPSQEMAREVVRSVIIPVLEKEINSGKSFAQLRQVYYSLILAKWYKENLKQSILTRNYADQRKVRGIEIGDKGAKDDIYAQYLEAFKKGAFNYIHEEYDAAAQQMLPRKYFSGGVGLQFKTEVTHDLAEVVDDKAEEFNVKVSLETPARDNAPEDLPVVNLKEWKVWFWPNLRAGQSTIYISKDKKQVLKVFHVKGMREEHVREIYDIISGLPQKLKERGYQGPVEVVVPKLVRVQNDGLGLVTEKKDGLMFESAAGRRKSGRSQKELQTIAEDFFEVVDNIAGRRMADRRGKAFFGGAYGEVHYMNFIWAKDGAGKQRIYNIDPIDMLSLKELRAERGISAVLGVAASPAIDGLKKALFDVLDKQILFSEVDDQLLKIYQERGTPASPRAAFLVMWRVIKRKCDTALHRVGGGKVEATVWGRDFEEKSFKREFDLVLKEGALRGPGEAKRDDIEKWIDQVFPGDEDNAELSEVVTAVKTVDDVMDELDSGGKFLWDFIKDDPKVVEKVRLNLKALLQDGIFISEVRKYLEKITLKKGAILTSADIESPSVYLMGSSLLYAAARDVDIVVVTAGHFLKQEKIHFKTADGYKQVDIKVIGRDLILNKQEKLCDGSTFGKNTQFLIEKAGVLIHGQAPDLGLPEFSDQEKLQKARTLMAFGDEELRIFMMAMEMGSPYKGIYRFMEAYNVIYDLLKRAGQEELVISYRFGDEPFKDFYKRFLYWNNKEFRQDGQVEENRMETYEGYNLQEAVQKKIDLLEAAIHEGKIVDKAEGVKDPRRLNTQTIIDNINNLGRRVVHARNGQAYSFVAVPGDPLEGGEEVKVFLKNVQGVLSQEYVALFEVYPDKDLLGQLEYDLKGVVFEKDLNEDGVDVTGGGLGTAFHSVLSRALPPGVGLEAYIYHRPTRAWLDDSFQVRADKLSFVRDQLRYEVVEDRFDEKGRLDKQELAPGQVMLSDVLAQSPMGRIWTKDSGFQVLQIFVQSKDLHANGILALKWWVRNMMKKAGDEGKEPLMPFFKAINRPQGIKHKRVLDAAEATGGIDLNADNMNVLTTGSGIHLDMPSGVEFVDPAGMEDLSPVIVSVTALESVRVFLSTP
jgi:hypothetical protein